MSIKMGDYHFKLKGGWETLRRHFIENEEDFIEFVDALNEDARRQ